MHYEFDLMDKITKSAQLYLSNFDINSLYSHSLLYVELSDMYCSKQHYRHFLRLNNRKKSHKPIDVTNAGYRSISVKWRWGDEGYDEYTEWLQENCKPGSYLHHNGEFWFAHDQDYVMFKMRWL